MKVVDMHCDTIGELWKAEKAGKPISLRSNSLHIDLEKMQKGDYLLQNFAMFVFLGREKDPLVNVLEMIDVYNRAMAENADIIGPVLNYEDIEKNRAAGKLSGMLTIEEGAVLKGNPYVVRSLYQLGVRMLTLTWNFENEIGYPNTIVKAKDYDPSRHYGLKPEGIEIVREMNRVGMIVDVSHLGDDGFWDVARHAKRPFLASHSCCRALRDHRRNLTDEMLKALADNSGLVGVNFYSAFLGPHEVSRTEDIVRHIRHVVDVGGEELAALGSDFDGIDCPLELEDAGHMDRLIRALEQGGFTPRQIERVCWQNAWDFYERTL